VKRTRFFAYCPHCKKLYLDTRGRAVLCVHGGPVTDTTRSLKYWPPGIDTKQELIRVECETLPYDSVEEFT
jgi:hypothetical protein